MGGREEKMIQKIRTRNFYIQNSDVIDFMRINQVQHLRFDVNIDDGVYVSVSYPDYNNLLSFEKRWFNIHWGKRTICVRNPSIFKDCIGKEVDVYSDKIFRKKNELFRIKPIGFNIMSNIKIKKKRVKINVPYFSKSGYCILPKEYIIKRNITDALISKLSFNRIDGHLVNCGFIFARITKEFEPGGLSYPLRECSNGACTRPLKRVVDIVSENGKKITDFQYKNTLYDDNYNYDLIIFKEVKLDGS